MRPIESTTLPTEITRVKAMLSAQELVLGQVDDAATIFDDTVGAAPQWVEYFKFRPNLPVRA